MQKGLLHHYSPFLKLIVLMMIVALTGLLSTFIGHLLASYVYGVDLTSLPSMMDNLRFLRTFQIIQSTLVFVGSSALATYLLYDDGKELFPGKGMVIAQVFMMTLFMVITVQGVVSWSAWVNHQLSESLFPKALLDWILIREDEALELTKVLVGANSTPQFIFNLVMVAIIPAIGEEWLFRGILQRELSAFLKNYHVAIVFTALVFSAIHMQFLTFLPRFILGILFGYLMVYTKSLWYPMLAHFINNSLALWVYTFYAQGGDTIDMSDSNQYSDFSSYLRVGGSMVVVILFMILIRRTVRMYESSHKESLED